MLLGSLLGSLVMFSSVSDILTLLFSTFIMIESLVIYCLMKVAMPRLPTLV